MPVQPTYPGVYVQEIASGVRTITGVSTSIALFIGRAKMGPLKEPKLILNYSDFERTFSSEYADSDMARAVRLFFQNGGTQCYVMRIADSTAAQSEVTLENEAGTPVIKVIARSPGLVGDAIRLAVTYNGLDPETTFNLEVFRWAQNGSGQPVKSDVENWSSLSMDPNSPRYAETYVNQNSKLIELNDLGVAPATDAYSQSGRPVPSGDNADAEFRDRWMALIGTTSADPVTALPTNRFRISIDAGASFADVNLAGIDFTNDADLAAPDDARSNLSGKIETEINSLLPTDTTVTVSMEPGPGGATGSPNENTVMLRIASTSGDVRIQPASTEDLTGRLMLGTAQGGVEVSRYAYSRPAPTGMVFKLDNLDKLDKLVEFSALVNTAFQIFTIASTAIDLTNTLQTGLAGNLMYQDAYSPSVNENSDGVREKWGLIAGAVNAEKASNPTFKWSAEIWGSRLALIPGDGGENSQGTIVTDGGDAVDIGPGGSDLFIHNVRYYR